MTSSNLTNVKEDMRRQIRWKKEQLEKYETSVRIIKSEIEGLQEALEKLDQPDNTTAEKPNKLSWGFFR